MPTDEGNDKAERIVEAMSRCVAKYGPAGATFEQVAAEAGVSRGLLHYYFGSKDQLMLAVLDRRTELVMRTVRAGIEQSNTAEEALATMFNVVTTLAQNRPELFLIAFETLGEVRRRPEFGDAIVEHSRQAVAAFQQGIEEVARLEGLKLRHSPEATAAALRAIGNGLAFAMLERPDDDHEPMVRAMVDAARYLLSAS